MNDFYDQNDTATPVEDDVADQPIAMSATETLTSEPNDELSTQTRLEEPENADSGRLQAESEPEPQPSPYERPFAVVTGASSGIGFELAKILAKNSYDLILAAQGEDLDQAADEISLFGTNVDICAVDLASFTGVEKLVERVQAYNRPVDVLCINAGVGVSGEFSDTSFEEELNLINLNVVSAVHLCKRLLPDMVERDAGRVMFTSSVAGVMPGPFEAVYSGSKAFLLIFSESLAEELRESNVTVTAVLPGPTETNFFHRAGMQDTQMGHDEKDSAAEVAQRAYDAVMAGKQKAYVGGFKSRVLGMLGDLLPDEVGGQMRRQLSEPGGNASLR